MSAGSNKFLDAFSRFSRDHQGQKIGVFFHTSILCETMENIKAFFTQKSGDISVFIPENCWCELAFLARYSSDTATKYSEKAKYVLNAGCRHLEWSLADIVKNKSFFLPRLGIDTALFVFFEPSAADDFSVKMGQLENVFLLSYDPFFDNPFKSPVPIGQPVKRMCRPLDIRPMTTTPKATDVLRICDRDLKAVKRILRSELQSMETGGGEATLYKHPSMENKVFKIFRFEIGSIMAEKLRSMMSLKAVFPHCAFPTELVYCEGNCIGYVMEKVDGRCLDCVLVDYGVDDCIELIRQLITLLLELRLAQIYVTDLSSANIFASSDRKTVWLIDCDSVEFYKYPGGGVTAPYGHPDITGEYHYQKLRTAEQINFSFAVLLFEILIGDKNPLTQGNLGIREPEWKKDPFPLGNCNGVGVCAEGRRVTPAKLENWCDCPLPVREGFVETFNFRAVYDLGEWIKRMNIL